MKSSSSHSSSSSSDCVSSSPSSFFSSSSCLSSSSSSLSSSPSSSSSPCRPLTLPPRLAFGYRLLVTVGTTSFDSLISAVNSPSFHAICMALNCSDMTCQIGRGSETPTRGQLVINLDEQINGAAEREEEVGTTTDYGWRRGDDDGDNNNDSAEGTWLGEEEVCHLPVSAGGCDNEICRVCYFRFIPSLTTLLSTHDFVISHCGAGSVLDALRTVPRVRLLAVVNTSLMDNHQQELAQGIREYAVVVEKGAQQLQEN
eukprot:GHVS01032838.1.p1 GENE.GHVS01032838.1~~GHVS01032838.1.p1  ORF type:complete len:257 (+),score=84.22 GHVS01032838.1:228-998(+)